MIDTQSYYFNKTIHTEMAQEINLLAASKKVEVSRWVNNSKNRQIVTYIVHTGERNSFAAKQENVLFKVSVDAGRGKRITDEMDMMRQIEDHLNTIAVVNPVVFVNGDERYGDDVNVTVADYEQLNPEGDFRLVDGEIREYFENTPYLFTIQYDDDEMYVVVAKAQL